jgi:hypothetical protein
VRCGVKNGDEDHFDPAQNAPPAETWQAFEEPIGHRSRPATPDHLASRAQGDSPDFQTMNTTIPETI